MKLGQGDADFYLYPMRLTVNSKLAILSLLLCATPLTGGPLWWPVTALRNEVNPAGSGTAPYYLVFGGSQQAVAWQSGPVAVPSAEMGGRTGLLSRDAEPIYLARQGADFARGDYRGGHRSWRRGWDARRNGRYWGRRRRRWRLRRWR